MIYCLGDNCENAGRAYFCQFIRLLCKVSWAKRVLFILTFYTLQETVYDFSSYVSIRKADGA